MIKTVSLETAKLLKEAGFRQDTYWHFVRNLVSGDFPLCINCQGIVNAIASPTTDELLECLNNDDLIYKYLESNDMDGTDLIWLMRDPNRLAEAWLWIKKETE